MEYRQTARRHWIFYAATNAGLLVALGALSIERPWLRATAIAIGLLLLCGGLLLIIRNWQFGSRVDFETHQLIWWEGYPPSDEHHVPLEQIREAQIDVKNGKRQIILLDIDGQPILFSSRCAPAPWELWLRKINASVPHIILRQNFSDESTPDPTVETRHLDTPADLR